MIYLSEFTFPFPEEEYTYTMKEKRTCFTSFYPFQVLAPRGLRRLQFEPVTILYGSNGSGKTTALNVIAEKTHLQRDALYNRTSFFDDYLDLCDYEIAQPIPPESRIVTSDDVFDFMLDLRALNNGIDTKREELFEEYFDNRHAKFQLKSMDDYDQLKKINMARSKTLSKYVKGNLMQNVRTRSNGESAFMYFSEKIQENSLYLLDEPENSLSPARQQELMQFLEDSARFFGCQLIISTHSPFLLAMRGARIYNMDENPVRTCRWTDLENVRAYYDFFRQHANEFE